MCLCRQVLGRATNEEHLRERVGERGRGRREGEEHKEGGARNSGKLVFEDQLVNHTLLSVPLLSVEAHLLFIFPSSPVWDLLFRC